MSLMIFTLEYEVDLHTEHEDFVSSEQGSQKVYFEDFTEYFVVCPVELQGINNMLICPILSSYFSGPWSFYQACQFLDNVEKMWRSM